MSVAETATKLKQQAPPPIQTALHKGAAAVGPAAAKAQPYRQQIAIGAGAMVVILLLGRRIRRSR